jgi:hypothetical protein
MPTARVVVVHVELHQRDDAAELGDEAAEHARLVHAPQHRFGLAAVAQDRQEDAVGFRVLAQGRPDELQRAADLAQRIWMNGRVQLGSQPEQPDEIDRRVVEDIVVDRVDAAGIEAELRMVPDAAAKASGQAAQQAAQRRRLLHLAGFQHGAEDAREVADILGDEEIVLHEAFDVLEPAVRCVAEPLGQFRLLVEGQPVAALGRHEVQMAAHRPQKILALEEAGKLASGEQAHFRQFGMGLGAVDVFGDPEQRVEVAQAPLAVLDVGLDEIARFARPAVALVALGKLVGDERLRIPVHHLLVETDLQLVEQRPVAAHEARLDQRGQDRVVGSGHADRVVDAPRGMAHLEAEIPQHVEDPFDQALGPCGLLVGQQKQQVGVGARGQRAAAVAADGHQRQALGRGRVVGRIDVADGEVVERPDELVLVGRQTLGATAAAAVGHQLLLGAAARSLHGILQEAQQRRAEG